MYIDTVAMPPDEKASLAKLLAFVMNLANDAYRVEFHRNKRVQFHAMKAEALLRELEAIP